VSGHVHGLVGAVIGGVVIGVVGSVGTGSTMGVPGSVGTGVGSMIGVCGTGVSTGVISGVLTGMVGTGSSNTGTGSSSCGWRFRCAFATSCRFCLFFLALRSRLVSRN
jgi:hypothetical protein